MARQLRLEYPGAVYHVMSRGNARQNIYRSNDDRHDFLEVLADVSARCNWLCHAYCLMGNHYHLLIETPDANLSAGMQLLNGTYSQAFNRRHRRIGHVFQGRFKGLLVERDTYLLELCRYIVLNPVRAKMVTKAADYPWSSYRATACLSAPHRCLTLDWLLGQFGQGPASAARAYQRFVSDGVDGKPIWEDIKHQVFLGTPRFIEQMSPLLEAHARLDEVPRQQRFASRPSLEALFRCVDTRDKTIRNNLITAAHFHHGYGQSEIARYLGLHYSSISKIIEKSQFKM